MNFNIHQDQKIHRFGADPADANLAVILIHGRGAKAKSMLPLIDDLSLEKVNFILPQAGLNRWYPNSAFAPIETNEPDLTSALELIDSIVLKTQQEGFSNNQIMIGGFSQGACLTLEYAAQNPRNYAGIFAFSGALIGPPDEPRKYVGGFDGTPVFIGGSDFDPWIALELMVQTANVFEQLGAAVDFCTYSGNSHTITKEEINAVREMIIEIQNS